MVKLDTRNSRMKDFHDVWALAGAFAFDGTALQRAVVTCFECRGTKRPGETPRVLTPAFYRATEIATRWQHYLAAGAVLIPPPARFEEIGERIISFLGPVWNSIVESLEFGRSWEPDGTWRVGDGAGRR